MNKKRELNAVKPLNKSVLQYSFSFQIYFIVHAAIQLKGSDIKAIKDTCLYLFHLEDKKQAWTWTGWGCVKFCNG